MNITIRLTKVEYEMLKELQEKEEIPERDWKSKMNPW